MLEHRGEHRCGIKRSPSAWFLSESGAGRQTRPSAALSAAVCDEAVSKCTGRGQFLNVDVGVEAEKKGGRKGEKIQRRAEAKLPADLSIMACF